MLVTFFLIKASSALWAAVSSEEITLAEGQLQNIHTSMLNAYGERELDALIHQIEAAKQGRRYLSRRGFSKRISIIEAEVICQKNLIRQATSEVETVWAEHIVSYSLAQQGKLRDAIKQAKRSGRFLAGQGFSKRVARLEKALSSLDSRDYHDHAILDEDHDIIQTIRADLKKEPNIIEWHRLMSRGIQSGSSYSDSLKKATLSPVRLDITVSQLTPFLPTLANALSFNASSMLEFSETAKIGNTNDWGVEYGKIEEAPDGKIWFVFISTHGGRDVVVVEIKK